MHACLRGSKSFLHVTLIKPDFPSLADEIAQPRPGMNINVAAFTVSEKSSNMTQCLPEYKDFGFDIGDKVQG